MSLPIEFENRMKDVLDEKFALFVEQFDKPSFKALRVNTLKTDINYLKKKFPFISEPTLFCENSFYIPSDVTKLGKKSYAK